MRRDPVILSPVPVRIGELVAAVRGAGVPLGVQGVDGTAAAAVLDPAGRLVCAIAEPALVEDAAEIARLLPGATAPEMPCWWHDARTSEAHPELGAQILAAAAELVGGTVIG
ncbi:hypothetical protein USB125703_00162 [Pseudoclavibacter triregionum]|nr:hypothetical protein USB125703_00162 [Pseudoclavibacter triregionum]